LHLTGCEEKKIQGRLLLQPKEKKKCTEYSGLPFRKNHFIFQLKLNNMFILHFGVGLAAKKAALVVSPGTLFIAFNF